MFYLTERRSKMKPCPTCNKVNICNDVDVCASCSNKGRKAPVEDSQDWLSEILWDMNNATGVDSDDEELVAEAKSAIREHFLKEALSLIPEKADEDGSRGKWINGFNDANEQLRNKFNDKYKEV